MGSNLRRRNGMYWFRRRVPDALRQIFGRVEINRSLMTTCPRIARHRAKVAWLTTESVFRGMLTVYRSIPAEQADCILDRFRRGPIWASQTTRELLEGIDNADFVAADLLFQSAGMVVSLGPDDEAELVISVLKRLVERRERNGTSEVGEKEALRAWSDELRILKGQFRTFTGRHAVDLIPTSPDQPGPAPAPLPHPPELVVPAHATLSSRDDSRGPPQVLSSFVERFFSAKNYPKHTESQNRVSIRLWLEICGDRLTHLYTADDAYAFQAALRRLPAGHGKGGLVNAWGLIEHADAKARGQGRPVRRLAEKTVKRHFSLLNQLFKHLGKARAEQGIFSAVEHKVKPSKRIPWTHGALDKLLRARWNPNRRAANTVSETTHAWLVGTSGYTGARIEEIARLRPSDIQFVDNKPFFFIQTQTGSGEDEQNVEAEQEWTAKTPAGVRAVGVSPKLVEAGILKLAVQRLNEGHERLFDVEASGKLGNLGTVYSREFSRLKAALEIPENIVLHSFRHSVETILCNRKFPQRWIDVAMGHKSVGAGQPRKSVGLLVYFHGLDPENSSELAEAIEYPSDVCPLLLLKRVRGEVPW